MVGRGRVLVAATLMLVGVLAFGIPALAAGTMLTATICRGTWEVDALGTLITGIPNGNGRPHPHARES